MTDAANPERILFASTTQSFLEKEASLTRLRELHAAGTSFEADWWRRGAALGWASLLAAFVKRRQWSKAHPLIMPGLSERASETR